MIRLHTNTKKAVDRNDLRTNNETANAAIVTEILATGLGTETFQKGLINIKQVLLKTHLYSRQDF